MRAIVCKGKDEGVVVDNVPKPSAAAGDVVIKVSAAAMNRRDVFITQGLYPGWQTGLPCTLGADVCGEVVEVGEGVDQSWLQKTVIADPSLNWGDTEAYQSKTHNIIGMPRDGTFAEFVAVPAENLYDSPKHLDGKQAAAIPLAGVTAWRALVSRAACKPGDTVLVTGIGSGVQMFALQFAVAMGCTVVVTSSSQAKIDGAIALGAKGGLNYREKGWFKGCKEFAPKGFDVIIDAAGGDGMGDCVK
jgi:NADPH:quinone reductase-like Zn-dependent oxidoreductase